MAFVGMSHGFMFDSEDNYRSAYFCPFILLYHIVPFYAICFVKKTNNNFFQKLFYSLLCMYCKVINSEQQLHL